MSERGEMEAVIEAVLFVSSEPVPRTRLLELFEEEEREQAAEALAAVLARYDAGSERGVMVEDVAGGVRLVTRPEMGVWLRRFFDVSGGSKLSMAALETLAIVAYRQPITGPEIQELRSVSPVGVLKTLLEKRLVRIAGRKEVVGKPFLYATTREFLVHFGLNSLRDLPPLEEFEETFGAAAGLAASGAMSAGSAGGAGAGVGGSGAEGVTEGGEAAGAGWAPDREGEGDEEDAGDSEESFLREAAALDELGQEGEEPAAQEPGQAQAARPRRLPDAEPGEGGGGTDAAAESAAEWGPAAEDELTAASWEAAVEEDLAGGEDGAAGEAETAAAGSKVER